MINKTIKINDVLHRKIKRFCNSNDYKLNKWCESQLEGQLLYCLEYEKLKNVSKSKIVEESSL